MLKRIVFFVVLPAVALLGCSRLAEDNPLQPGVTSAGANQLIDADDLEVIDLVCLLDPDGRARQRYNEAAERLVAKKAEEAGAEGAEGTAEAESVRNVCNEQQDDDSPWAKLDKGEQIDLAFVSFYDDGYVEPATLRRNRVQERILIASNQRCNLFKSYIQRLRSHSNFILGSLSTITGVIGGIVTGAGSARALSGTSGIFSGVRAEFNQDLFNNAANEVIADGIDLRRRHVYEQIVLEGQRKEIEIYTVEAAVKDAIFYHGQCSILEGFKAASESIKKVDDPGIDAANRTLAKLRLTQKLLQDDEFEPVEAATSVVEIQSILEAGSPVPGNRDALLPSANFIDASLKIQRALNRLEQDLNELSPDTNSAAAKNLTSSIEAIDKAAENSLTVCKDLGLKEESDFRDKMAKAEIARRTPDDQEKSKKALEAQIAWIKVQSVTRAIQEVRDRILSHVTSAREVLDELDSFNEKKVAEAVQRLDELKPGEPDFPSCSTTS